jgi:opacity protein-like surface antigen
MWQPIATVLGCVGIECGATLCGPTRPTVPLDQEHHLDRRPFVQALSGFALLNSCIDHNKGRNLMPSYSVAKRLFVAFTSLSVLLIIAACADMSQPQSAPAPEVISRPDHADVSPNFDFTRISGVGVFPAFPSGQEIPEFSDAFSGAFTQALQARQSQWKVISPRDLVQNINTAGLGKGYKNLQADVNTFGQGAQIRVLTGSTQEFLEKLGHSLGVNAFLLSSYAVSDQSMQRLVQPSMGAALLGAQPYMQPYVVHHCTVQVTLYQLGSGFMWTASHTIISETNQYPTEGLGKVFAAYVGKGTLRQL